VRRARGPQNGPAAQALDQGPGGLHTAPALRAAPRQHAHGLAVSFLFSWMNETYVFSKANVRLVAAALRLQHIVLAYMARGAWYMVLTHGATQNLHRCDTTSSRFVIHLFVQSFMSIHPAGTRLSLSCPTRTTTTSTAWCVSVQNEGLIQQMLLNMYAPGGGSRCLV